MGQQVRNTVSYHAQILMGNAALVLYEYLITFDKEVEYVWNSKKRRKSSPLLLAIRWTVVLLVIFYQLPTPPGVSSSFHSASVFLSY